MEATANGALKRLCSLLQGGCLAAYFYYVGNWVVELLACRGGGFYDINANVGQGVGAFGEEHHQPTFDTCDCDMLPDSGAEDVDQ